MNFVTSVSLLSPLILTQGSTCVFIEMLKHYSTKKTQNLEENTTMYKIPWKSIMVHGLAS